MKITDDVRKLQAFVRDVLALISESEGVAGLHHNGEVATWDDLIRGEFDWLSSLDGVAPLPSSEE